MVEKLTKNQKRDAAREQARLLREKEKKRNFIRRIVTTGVVALSSLAVVGLVIIVIFTSTQTPAASASPLNMASGGVVVENGFNVVKTGSVPEGEELIPTKADTERTQIIVYIDYLCPFCNLFEQENQMNIEGWLADDLVTVEYHPIAILSEYSLRAANASSCVVNYSPANYWDYHTSLFDNQPAESQAGGLSNDTLIDLAETADVDNLDDIKACINNGQFEDWIGANTTATTTENLPGLSAPLSGTPTVVVNGEQYAGNLDASSFKEFVEGTFK